MRYVKSVNKKASGANLTRTSVRAVDRLQEQPTERTQPTEVTDLLAFVTNPESSEFAAERVAFLAFLEQHPEGKKLLDEIANQGNTDESIIMGAAGDQQF